MHNNDIKVIQEKIGYRFNNIALLKQAFIRKTYSEEKGGFNNEVLEFIGDAALNAATVKILVEIYGQIDKETNQFNPIMDEGAYTNARKKLVEKQTLSLKMEELGFNQYLVLGKGDIKIDVKDDNSVKEDLFEAIIGAVALDCKWNYATIVKVVKKMLQPEKLLKQKAETIDENYIGLVQVWSQKKSGKLPEYTHEKRDKEYSVTLKIPTIKRTFNVHDISLKKAKAIAAKQGYNYLKRNDLLPNIQKALRYINYQKATGQLLEISQKKYISKPIFNLKKVGTLLGGENWLCICTIESEKIRVEKIGQSKVEAKKIASEEALHLLQIKYNK